MKAFMIGDKVHDFLSGKNGKVASVSIIDGSLRVNFGANFENVGYLSDGKRLNSHYIATLRHGHVDFSKPVRVSVTKIKEPVYEYQFGYYNGAYNRYSVTSDYLTYDEFDKWVKRAKLDAANCFPILPSERLRK